MSKPKCKSKTSHLKCILWASHILRSPPLVSVLLLFSPHICPLHPPAGYCLVTWAMAFSINPGGIPSWSRLPLWMCSSNGSMTQSRDRPCPRQAMAAS
eukprot:13247-Amphidinium_carterae.1